MIRELSYAVVQFHPRNFEEIEPLVAWRGESLQWSDRILYNYIYYTHMGRGLLYVPSWVHILRLNFCNASSALKSQDSDPFHGQPWDAEDTLSIFISPGTIPRDFGETGRGICSLGFGATMWHGSHGHIASPGSGWTWQQSCMLPWEESTKSTNACNLNEIYAVCSSRTWSILGGIVCQAAPSPCLDTNGDRSLDIVNRCQ